MLSWRVGVCWEGWFKIKKSQDIEKMRVVSEE